MTFDRRSFLIRTGLGLAGGLAASSAVLQQTKTKADAPHPFESWDEVRAQFELTRDYIHLAAMLLAAHPAPVREAIERHRRELDRNPVHYLSEKSNECEERVLQAAAVYLGAQPEDIALTDSTTMGLALLYGGLKLRDGQEVVTTTHDHYSTHESLRLRSAKTGARVRHISLYKKIETVTEGEIVDSILRALVPKTRLVAVTWVHSSTGLKLPVRRIADALAGVNARRDDKDRVLLSVDGVHGFGVEDVTVESLGCDFFVAGCHKWIFGPRGTGLVWGHPKRAWPWASATIPTFSLTTDGEPAGAYMTPGGFHSFEHRWALAEAFEFHQRIGKARVAGRVHELSRQLKEGLAQMSHVKLYTPLADNLSAGIVCFDVQGLKPYQVVERLKEKRIIASVTPYSPPSARFSPGILNTPEEIDSALAAVRALAK